MFVLVDEDDAKRLSYSCGCCCCRRCCCSRVHLVQIIFNCTGHHTISPWWHFYENKPTPWIRCIPSCVCHSSGIWLSWRWLFPLCCSCHYDYPFMSHLISFSPNGTMLWLRKNDRWLWMTILLNQVNWERYFLYDRAHTHTHICTSMDKHTCCTSTVPVQ